MGAILNTIKAGIPPALVISVVPATHIIGGGSIKSPGKQPALPHEDAGWIGAPHWEKGMPLATLAAADKAGGNAGLRCGYEADGVRFYCLDFDIDVTDEGSMDEARAAAVATLRKCLSALGAALNGHDFAYRRTWDWRGSVLVQVPGSSEPGPKRVVKLRKNGKKIGKIELLAKGQQTVVSGSHLSGNAMSWSSFMSPNVVSPYPILLDDWIPPVKDYAAVSRLVDSILATLQQDGFELDASAPGEGFTGGNGSLPSDEEQAAPSKELLLRVLKELPNPADIERDTYARQQIAVVGCLRAMSRLGRITNGREVNDVLNAAAEWAARWEGPTPRSFDDERNEFPQNWQRVEGAYAGWRHIAELAIRLGVKDVQVEAAQATFAPLEDAPLPPPPPDDGSLLRHIARLSSGWKSGQLLAAVMADAKVAKALSDPITGLGKIACYVPDDKRWLVFQGANGWTDELARASVAEMVEKLLVDYVASYQMDGAIAIKSDRDQASMLSHKRIQNMISLMENKLAVRVGDIDQGEYVLQTPEGATDLRTGRRVGLEDLRTFRDTRRTRVAPAEGPCPLFDDLLWNLANRNPLVLGWLWAYLGYALLGQPNEHCFVFLWGPGGNGKSVLIAVLEDLLGSYACILDRDVVLQAGRDRHPASLYRLRSARLAMISEMPPNEKWNEARLKALTGRDKTEARKMHANPVTFRPEAAFLVAGQHMPKFHRVDNSVARRVRVVNSNRVPTVPDRRLEQKIIATELPAILYRMIAEARKVYDAGLVLPPVPAEMQREASKYLAEQDAFHGWFSQACLVEVDNPDLVLVSDLRGDYEAHCADLSREESGGDDLATLDMIPVSAFPNALRRCGAITEGEDGRKLTKLVGTKSLPAVKGIRFLRGKG